MDLMAINAFLVPTLLFWLLFNIATATRQPASEITSLRLFSKSNVEMMHLTILIHNYYGFSNGATELNIISKKWNERINKSEEMNGSKITPSYFYLWNQCIHKIPEEDRLWQILTNPQMISSRSLYVSKRLGIWEIIFKSIKSLCIYSI